MTKFKFSNVVDIVKDLYTILDFVERWNKQDKEVKVAKAANRLEKVLDDIINLDI